MTLKAGEDLEGDEGRRGATTLDHAAGGSPPPFHADPGALGA